MPLNLALESNNAEMTKRLKYTKDILTHMLNNNNNKGSTMGSTGTINTAGSSSRPGTINSAVSSKRSVLSGGEIGIPSSVTGRTTSNNIGTSDRKPLNVLN